MTDTTTDPTTTGPSALAIRIREQLRVEHASCNVQGGATDCHLGKLWAEDIQEILDLAAECPGHAECGGCDECRCDAELHHDQVVL